MEPPVNRSRRPIYGDFAITDADAPLIAKLSPLHRQILNQQGTVKAIAAELHLTEGTVKSRQHRARAALTVLRNSPAKDESTPG